MHLYPAICSLPSSSVWLFQNPFVLVNSPPYRIVTPIPHHHPCLNLSSSSITPFYFYVQCTLLSSLPSSILHRSGPVLVFWLLQVLKVKHKSEDYKWRSMHEKECVVFVALWLDYPCQFPKSWQLELRSYKTKRLYTAKETARSVKRQPTEWKKMQFRKWSYYTKKRVLKRRNTNVYQVL